MVNSTKDKKAESAKTNKKTKDVIRFDWAMKNMLRNKANFDILEGFLSALLKQDLKILKILESESNRNEEKLKFNRVDMLVEDKNGKKIIIEVQNETESDYLYRLLFGTSKVITEYLELGKPYKEISKVISISILYFNIQGDDYLYYGDTEFKGIHTGNPIGISETYIENGQKKERNVTTSEIYPEYYLIDVKKFSNIIKEDIDEWIYMFKNNKVEPKFTSKNIQKAAGKLNILKMERKKRLAYDKYLMSLASEKDVLATAKRDGLAEGEQIGIAKGKLEEKRETAKKLKEEGLPTETIARITGLSSTEIATI